MGTADLMDRNWLIIKDLINSHSWHIPCNLLEVAEFDPTKWYQEILSHQVENQLSLYEIGSDITFERQSFRKFMQSNSGGIQSISPPPYAPNRDQNEAPLIYLANLVQEESEEEEIPVILNRIQVTRGTYPAMQ